MWDHGYNTHGDTGGMDGKKKSWSTSSSYVKKSTKLYTMWRAQQVARRYDVACAARSTSLRCGVHSKEHIVTMWRAQQGARRYDVACTARSTSLRCGVHSKEHVVTMWRAQQGARRYDVVCTARRPKSRSDRAKQVPVESMNTQGRRVAVAIG